MLVFGFVHQRVGKEKAFQAGGIMQKQTKNTGKKAHVFS